MMKVKELIALLQGLDQEAEVGTSMTGTAGDQVSEVVGVLIMTDGDIVSIDAGETTLGWTDDNDGCLDLEEVSIA